MSKKLLLAAGLFVTSFSSSAASISHNGFQLDTNANIVRGAGLDWLRWDLTTGQSIRQALDTYSGWRLATNAEMAKLFSTFGFGQNYWHSAELGFQRFTSPYSAGHDNSVQQTFISLFGKTDQSSCSVLNRSRDCFDDADPYQISTAAYGADLNKNGRYNEASVWDDSLYINAVGSLRQMDHVVTLSSDFIGENNINGTRGIALVRTQTTPVPLAPVSAPATLGLLLCGLVVAVFNRRRQACC